MNLIIDIGNSRVKLAIFRDGDVIADTVSAEISTELIDNIKDDYPELKHAIVSAVREYPSDVKSYLKETFAPFIELNHHTPVPITNKYQTPETLGKDRLAAAVGAVTLFPERNILVIDAGTAITYELINDRNEFLGGNISPGLNTRFRSLNQFTGKLPLISAKESFQLVGTNTETAIRAGVQQGILFEVEQYISHFNNLYKNLQIIITGGDANFFDRNVKKSIFVCLNLTLIGLNRILEYNVKET